MPIVVTLADLIFKEMTKHGAGMPVAAEGMMKKHLSQIVDTLTAAGWAILPPGAAAPGSVTREAVTVEPTSYFCPGCGKHKPAIGLSCQNAEFPGMGLVGIMTLFCGVESCRRIFQVILTPPMEARPHEGQVGHA